MWSWTALHPPHPQYQWVWSKHTADRNNMHGCKLDSVCVCVRSRIHRQRAQASFAPQLPLRFLPLKKKKSHHLHLEVNFQHGQQHHPHHPPVERASMCTNYIMDVGVVGGGGTRRGVHGHCKPTPSRPPCSFHPHLAAARLRRQVRSHKARCR